VVLLALRAAWMIHVQHRKDAHDEFSSVRIEFLAKSNATRAREHLVELQRRVREHGLDPAAVGVPNENDMRV